jgi:hypothetical protein
VFIYEGLAVPKWNKDGTVPGATDPNFSQARLGNQNITNAISLPIRKKLQRSNKTTHHLTDDTFADNKPKIDSFISNLDHAIVIDGKTPVWPQGGLAQALIGADDVTGDNFGNAGDNRSTFGSETFNHLSEKLRKFGYTNKNYEKTAQGESLLMKDAPVTNQDVEDQLLLKCYIK